MKIHISTRLSPATVEILDRVQRLLNVNRTEAIELLVDLIDSNMNDVMIQRHYDMIYKFAKVDSRRTKR